MSRLEPLGYVKGALGDDLTSLIAGHDIDVDRRQRNREIVCSGNYKPTKEEMQTLLKSIPGKRRLGDGVRLPAPRLSLVLR
jgi:hypothetical protein